MNKDKVREMIKFSPETLKNPKAADLKWNW